MSMEKSKTIVKFAFQFFETSTLSLMTVNIFYYIQNEHLGFFLVFEDINQFIKLSSEPKLLLSNQFILSECAARFKNSKNFEFLGLS